MTSPTPLRTSSTRLQGARSLVLSLGLAGALFVGTAQAQTAAPAPLATVPSVDLERYMGRWYEIARFPNRFQKDCSGPATADYLLQPGGRVQVTNRCPQADGKTDEAIGEARRVGEAGSPRLEVRFAPAWLSWLPMVWGNYWVIDLDPAYTLAVVSEPKREFLWVLARQPQVDAATWEALMARLRAQGFDLARLKPAGPTPGAPARP
ncbi:lipocalin family protein [Rubrivivax rivuli]|uniref:Outer membrane lipoprotein Blc n=1 Tax=Rubrivivax rivuli TaxID=1862385 RepID=A0A437RSE5_9BURK|nr:lipocalin family protein [Rubrivivax rivuli]RVU49679.1 lipocalin [Rubrivivax rivuli]